MEAGQAVGEALYEQGLAGLANSSRGTKRKANCRFVWIRSACALYMITKAAIAPGEPLLVDYAWRRRRPRRRC